MTHSNTDEGRNRSGGARRGRANFLRHATCLQCGRGAALTRNRAALPDDVTFACRYCNYAELRPTGEDSPDLLDVLGGADLACDVCGGAPAAAYAFGGGEATYCARCKGDAEMVLGVTL
jgi:hypothetical protein